MVQASDAPTLRCALADADAVDRNLGRARQFLAVSRQDHEPKLSFDTGGRVALAGGVVTQALALAQAALGHYQATLSDLESQARAAGMAADLPADEHAARVAEMKAARRAD